MFDSAPPGQAMNPLKRTGFTLIELLVVVTILLLLMSLVVTGISRSIARAKQVGCMSNLRQIYSGMLMYATDHQGWFSPNRPLQNSSGVFQSDPSANRNWFVWYDHYLESPEVFRCPAMTDGETNVRYVIPADEAPSGKETVYRVGYTMLEHLSSNWLWDIRPSNFETVTRLMASGTYAWVGVILSDGYYRVNGWGNWGPEKYEGATIGGRGRYRHGRRANFLLADGRVSSAEDTFVFELPLRGRLSLLPSMLP